MVVDSEPATSPSSHIDFIQAAMKPSMVHLLVYWLIYLGHMVMSNEKVMVKTKYGALSGTRHHVPLTMPSASTVTSTVDEFLGIPYAAPPVGSRRLDVPHPVKPWTNVRDASKHGWVCPQNASFNRTQPDLQSEDCLYLNVYSPFEGEASRHKYPVMVFIHGGSYLYGSGNRYNGTVLAQFGVVLVAINYRLGALGFLTTGDSATLMGNYGLLDQIQALRWVQDNIHHFRGDRSKVTIFGGSAGGASVGLLLFSDHARGLFHRVIAMSGTANAMWATNSKSNAKLRQDVIAFAQGFGCQGNSDAEHIHCLRKMPWANFNSDKICQILLCTEVDPLFKPVVDGILLKHSVDYYLKQRLFPAIPYMTGTVRAEFGEHYSDGFTQQELAAEVDRFLVDSYHGNLAILDVIKYEYSNWTFPHTVAANQTPASWYMYYDRADVLSDMGLVAPTDEMAAFLASRDGMQVYAYHLNHTTSYHSVELNHVFGTPYIGGSVDEMNILRNFTDLDRQLSIRFMMLWTNFAKYGNPTPDVSTLGFKWSPIKPNNMEYLYLTETSHVMRTHLRSKKVALWNIVLPNLLAFHSVENLNIFDSKTWFFFGLSVALLLIAVLLLCIIIQGNKRGKKYSQLLRGNSGTSYSVNL